jgi:hypothetical protein
METTLKNKKKVVTNFPRNLLRKRTKLRMEEP